MSNLRNNVRLIGNVGNDPEIKPIENGQMARFKIATNESYKNAKGMRVESVQWHQIVGFGKMASQIEKFLSKGKEVCITGKLVHRSFETTGGDTAYISEVIIDEFFLTGGKGPAIN